MLCFDDNGQVVNVQNSPIGFRSAVYGILIENQQILLQPHPDTDLWHPPGKILDIEETPTSAVLRCFQATAGITPILTSLLLAEDRCWVDSQGQPWQLSVLYYALKRPTAGAAGLITFDSPARPEWFPLENLTRNKMLFGYEAIEAGRIRLSLTPS